MSSGISITCRSRGACAELTILGALMYAAKRMRDKARIESKNLSNRIDFIII